MKARAITLLLLLAAAAPSWAADASDARQVRLLQEKTGATTLVPLQADRVQLAQGLAEVAGAAGAPQADLSGWNSQDYDALFALLQQYREELAALGVKQAAMDAAMDALKQRIADLEARMEYLPPDGMKIHGRFNILADDFLLTGPGANPNPGTATRYRHFKQHVQLEFTVVEGPFFGLTQVDLVNYVGSYSAPEPLGIRRVFAELRTPVSIQVGNLYSKMTPFTIWRPEEEDPYAPEPFKGRAERLRESLNLLDDHSQYLSGMRVLTEVMLTETKALELEGMYSVLNGAGATVYTPADPKTGASLSDYAGYYVTYLTAWKAEMEVFKGLRLGYYGTELFDDRSSANAALTTTAGDAIPIDGFDNGVHDGHLGLKAFDGLLEVQGDYALSRYSNHTIGYVLEGVTTLASNNAPNYYADPDLRAGGYTLGSAMYAAVGLGPQWAHATLNFRQVSDNFINPAAQNRTLDRNRSPYGPFLTENSQFNPSTGGFGGFSTFPFANFAETQFNSRIVTPNIRFGTNYMLNYLLPYDLGWDSGSPYGLATPNRSGYGVQADFSMWKGTIQPSLKLDISQQIKGEGNSFLVTGVPIYGTPRPIEHYTMARAGLIVDLKPKLDWPVKFTAGYRIEDTRAEAPWAPELSTAFYPGGLAAAQVAFDSTRLDMGLEYFPVPATGLFVGYRHLDYNGTYYNADSTYAPRGQYAVQELYEAMGGGISQKIGDRIEADISYTNQVFPERTLSLTTGKAVAYELEQIFLRFSVSF